MSETALSNGSRTKRPHLLTTKYSMLRHKYIYSYREKLLTGGPGTPWPPGIPGGPADPSSPACPLEPLPPGAPKSP